MDIIVFFPAFSTLSISLSFPQCQKMKPQGPETPQNQTDSLCFLRPEVFSEGDGRSIYRLFCLIPTSYQLIKRTLGLICSGPSDLETKTFQECVLLHSVSEVSSAPCFSEMPA